MRIPEEGNRWLTYSELATKLIPYVKNMGYTHVELLPITEHPFDGSWGYQTTGYFAVTSRHGSPEDFMAFVDTAHQAGIGVLMDWTPRTFQTIRMGSPSLTARIFTTMPTHGSATIRTGTAASSITIASRSGNFLLNSGLFWLDRYHIDGLRVDAVASMLYLDYGRKEGEWIPNQYGGH